MIVCPVTMKTRDETQASYLGTQLTLRVVNFGGLRTEPPLPKPQIAPLSWHVLVLRCKHCYLHVLSPFLPVGDLHSTCFLGFDQL